MRITPLGQSEGSPAAEGMPDPLDRLLARAAKAPLKDKIHRQLDEMFPPCPPEDRHFGIDLESGVDGLSSLFERMGSKALVIIAYTLPEIGRINDRLFAPARKRQRDRLDDGGSWLTVAELLETLVHTPSYEPHGFEWDHPFISLCDGVLEVEQSSTCRYYEGGRSRQTNFWILYRVKGRLVRVHSMNSYRSSGGR